MYTSAADALSPAIMEMFSQGRGMWIFFCLFKLMTYYKKVLIVKTSDVGQRTKMRSQLTAPCDA